MYTVEASGPRVTVPFGGAAEFRHSGSGEQIAEAMRLEMVSAFQPRGDYLSGASETGGLAAADMEEALSDVAADAAGYYQITFIPNLQETDGAWHPISVSVPGRAVPSAAPTTISHRSPKTSKELRQQCSPHSAMPLLHALTAPLTCGSSLIPEAYTPRSWRPISSCLRKPPTRPPIENSR